MKEVIEFFEGLFRYDLWPARWNCGYWSDFHGWLYIISEIMVWTAYFLIPLIILNYFSRKGSSIRFRKVYLLFATFILLCGSTHFIDALMFWIPMYRFNAVVRLATGIVSLFTVYHLFRVLPELFKQKTNIELEREIRRRKEAEQKLEEANQGLAAFAYVASHDLQEPIRKISTFSNLLYERNAGQFDEKSRWYADRVTSSARRMQSIIQDVLALSSLQALTHFEPVKTSEIVQKAIDDLELAIAEKGADIQVDSLPDVRGNAAYLTQLFYNLISNALKFTDKKPFIRISGERIDDAVFIQIEDNGIGMEKEDQQRIFGAFQRLHGRSEYEGTGIGLAIVKKIVEIHDGQIDVESRVGEGTTFTINLQSA
ncbi:MAG TPA: ATP-binding protein [Flavisolibacter sp.]|jgi:signal transduction histidine kinase|nr:ATP-binding protein [Flavisolibacter sp.]